MWVAMVWWSAHRLGNQEIRGSNHALGSIKKVLKNNSQKFCFVFASAGNFNSTNTSFEQTSLLQDRRRDGKKTPPLCRVNNAGP